jgi:CheY-like chemotaxis protein
MQHYNSILIVDDSPTSQMIVQRCVEMSGISADSFVFAENGIDAISKISDNVGIDLIFSDINMPKMDGQTFIRLMKSKPETSGIPIVITSSIADGSLESDMNRLGITAFIKKPISPEKILKVLGGNA